MRLLARQKQVGDNVVIIGGGLTGCEIAYELQLQGKHPVIVEMKNDLIAVKGVCLANSSYLREYFALHKVPVHLETKLVAITDNGVKVQDMKTGKEFEIPAESVIMSVGYKPAPRRARGQTRSRCRRQCESRQSPYGHLGRMDVAMKL